MVQELDQKVFGSLAFVGESKWMQYVQKDIQPEKELLPRTIYREIKM